jgi:hypothetical protein
MHCMRSERAIAITRVVRRLSQQSACAEPSLQPGYCLSAGYVRLALSTLFPSLHFFPVFIRYTGISYKCAIRLNLPYGDSASNQGLGRLILIFV